MIDPRARRVAEVLFPDEVHTGDCRAERGREGEPCRVCAAKNEAWDQRLAVVQATLKQMELL